MPFLWLRPMRVRHGPGQTFFLNFAIARKPQPTRSRGKKAKLLAPPRPSQGLSISISTRQWVRSRTLMPMSTASAYFITRLSRGAVKHQKHPKNVPSHKPPFVPFCAPLCSECDVARFWNIFALATHAGRYAHWQSCPPDCHEATASLQILVPVGVRGRI